MITNEILKLAGVKTLPPAIIMENTPIHKDSESIGTVKHVLIAAIKHYNKEHNQAESINLKHEYKTITDKLDSILGHIKGGAYKEAKTQWASLDKQVKNNIVHKITNNDEQYTVVSYFEPDTDVNESYTLLEYAKDPHDRAVSKDIHSLELLAHKLAHHQSADMGKDKHDHNDVEVAKIILKLEKILTDLKKAQHKDEVSDHFIPDDDLDDYKSDYEREKEEGDEAILQKSMGESVENTLNEEVEVEYMEDFLKKQAAETKKEDKVKEETTKVPTAVISDIKAKIKDIEDEVKYIAHLPNVSNQLTNDVHTLLILNELLEYLKTGCEYSMKMAMTLIQTVDSATRVQIPVSVWEFLSINLYPSPGGNLMNRFKAVKAKNKL
jgi:hypothetical protein